MCNSDEVAASKIKFLVHLLRSDKLNYKLTCQNNFI